MKGGKLVHRLVSAERANLLRQAIANYRRLRKLLRSWENETERLIDAQADRPALTRLRMAAAKLPGNAVGDVRNVGCMVGSSAGIRQRYRELFSVLDERG
jgi:hypothetical protein